MRALKRIVTIAAALGLHLISAPLCEGKQTQPDPKRVKEIQAALIAYGYVPGKTWPETQNILREIAKDHHWQTHRVPDARVLILLGLGNKYSDPSVAAEGRNHLDGRDPDK